MSVNGSGSPRLVQSPVFVLGTPRCGSTLLRMLLDSHSQIRAPQEMYLRLLAVRVPKALAAPAMASLDLDARELEHLLWDRVMHRELVRSGKQIIADKTPFNAHAWERLVECWPQARFVYLLRNPVAIIDSLARLIKSEVRVTRSIEKEEREVLNHARAVNAARLAMPGHTLRYEDLVADPECVTRDLCSFVGVDWEPAMVEYGAFDHGPPGLGDPSDKLRSGRIQPARALPDRPLASAELVDIALSWGYDARVGGTTRDEGASTAATPS